MSKVSYTLMQYSQLSLRMVKSVYRSIEFILLLGPKVGYSKSFCK